MAAKIHKSKILSSKHKELAHIEGNTYKRHLAVLTYTELHSTKFVPRKLTSKQLLDPQKFIASKLPCHAACLVSQNYFSNKY